MKTVLRINEKYRHWLSDMGLLTFEPLMFGDIGSVIERTEYRDTRRIEGHGRVAYLKRRLTTPWQTSLEMYVLEQRAHTAPFNEYLHVLALQQYDLPVMDVIAAGERRALGLPRYGFVLVDEVTGTALSEVLGACRETCSVH